MSDLPVGADDREDALSPGEVVVGTYADYRVTIFQRRKGATCGAGVVCIEEFGHRGVREGGVTLDRHAVPVIAELLCAAARLSRIEGATP